MLFICYVFQQIVIEYWLYQSHVMEISMNVKDMIPDFAELTSAMHKKVIQMKHQWGKLWIHLNYAETATNDQIKMPTVHGNMWH